LARLEQLISAGTRHAASPRKVFGCQRWDRTHGHGAPLRPRDATSRRYGRRV